MKSRFVVISDEHSKLFGHRFLNSQLSLYLGLVQLLVCVWALSQHIWSIVNFEKILHCDFSPNSTLPPLLTHVDAIIFDIGLFHHLWGITGCVAQHLDGGYGRFCWCVSHTLALLTCLPFAFVSRPKPQWLWPLLIQQSAYGVGMLILSLAALPKAAHILGDLRNAPVKAVSFYTMGTLMNFFLLYVYWHWYWHVESLWNSARRLRRGETLTKSQRRPIRRPPGPDQQQNLLLGLSATEPIFEEKMRRQRQLLQQEQQQQQQNGHLPSTAALNGHICEKKQLSVIIVEGNHPTAVAALPVTRIGPSASEDQFPQAVAEQSAHAQVNATQSLPNGRPFLTKIVAVQQQQQKQQPTTVVEKAKRKAPKLKQKRGGSGGGPDNNNTSFDSNSSASTATTTATTVPQPPAIVAQLRAQEHETLLRAPPSPAPAATTVIGLLQYSPADVALPPRVRHLRRMEGGGGGGGSSSSRRRSSSSNNSSANYNSSAINNSSAAVIIAGEQQQRRRPSSGSATGSSTASSCSTAAECRKYSSDREGGGEDADGNCAGFMRHPTKAVNGFAPPMPLSARASMPLAVPQHQQLKSGAKERRQNSSSLRQRRRLSMRQRNHIRRKCQEEEEEQEQEGGKMPPPPAGCWAADNVPPPPPQPTSSSLLPFGARPSLPIIGIGQQQQQQQPPRHQQQPQQFQGVQQYQGQQPQCWPPPSRAAAADHHHNHRPNFQMAASAWASFDRQPLPQPQRRQLLHHQFPASAGGQQQPWTNSNKNSNNGIPATNNGIPATTLMANWFTAAAAAPPPAPMPAVGFMMPRTVLAASSSSVAANQIQQQQQQQQLPNFAQTHQPKAEADGAWLFAKRPLDGPVSSLPLQMMANGGHAQGQRRGAAGFDLRANGGGGSGELIRPNYTAQQHWNGGGHYNAAPRAPFV